MLGRSRNSKGAAPPEAPPGGNGSSVAANEQALDTVAQTLRTLAEFALEQDTADLATFRAEAEGWARHVAVGEAPPGTAGGPPRGGSGRRDWEGVRRFVREYCQASAAHAGAVVSDLRETVWVFIKNFGDAVAQDEESDAVMKKHLSRLEQLTQQAAAADLKKEVLATLGGLSVLLEDRRKRQRRHVESLGQRVQALGSALESAQRENETDPLTGLYNRKTLDEYLARTVEMSRIFGQESALLLIDVDQFKTVNDSQGHTAGDETLRKVSDVVVRVFLRKSDFVARYGGDELAVVLRETAIKQAQSLGDRVLRAVRDLRLTGTQGPFEVTVSIGVAPVARDDEPSSWLDRADRGLYAAKRAGRDWLGLGE